MVRKKIISAIALLFWDATDLSSKVKGRAVQSSTFKVLLGFINLYIFLGFLLYLLVK